MLNLMHLLKNNYDTEKKSLLKEKEIYFMLKGIMKYIL